MTANFHRFRFLQFCYHYSNQWGGKSRRPRGQIMSNRIPRKVSLTHWTSFKSSSHVANTKSLFSFFSQLTFGLKGESSMYLQLTYLLLQTIYVSRSSVPFDIFSDLLQIFIQMFSTRRCKLWCLTFYSQRSQSIYVPIYFYLCYLYKCQMRSDWTLISKIDIS